MIRRKCFAGVDVMFHSVRYMYFYRGGFLCMFSICRKLLQVVRLILFTFDSRGDRSGRSIYSSQKWLHDSNTDAYRTMQSNQLDRIRKVCPEACVPSVGSPFKTRRIPCSCNWNRRLLRCCAGWHRHRDHSGASRDGCDDNLRSIHTGNRGDLGLNLAQF